MISPPFAPGDRKVPWLNQCPRGWQFKPLKYVCGINKHVLAETTEPENEFSYIDISSVDSDGRWTLSEPMKFADAPSRARRLLVDGDVLISTVRTYLRAITHVERVKEKLVCSTGFAVLSANDFVVPRFLAYWVRSNIFVDEVVARSVGVSYPAINASDIGNLPFPLIEVDRQRSIAAFLDREAARIDTLMEKKQRQIDLLQEKRAALIGHAVTKGLNPNVKMKDSGIEWLGKIPEHWEVKKLSWLFRYSKGLNAATLTKEYIGSNPGEFPVFSGQTENDGLMGMIDTHEFDFASPVVFVTTVGARAMTTRLVCGKFSLSQNCALIIPRNKDLDVRYYEGTLRRLFDFERRSISLIMQPSLRFDDLDSFRVPLPSLPEQCAIGKYLDFETARIDALVSKIEKSIEMLQEYRTALISAAVTGKIDVRNIKTQEGGNYDGSRA